MKFFSLNYSLSKDDYKYFSKTLNKSLFLQRLKLTAIVLAVAFVFTIMNLYSLAVTASFMLLIMFFVSDVVNRTYVMRMPFNSKMSCRKTQVDFYHDHIEVIYLPDDKFKGTSERHFPLGSVGIVMENEKQIYFSFEDNTKIIIPKDKIEKENYQKIKNMINNLYPDKFLEE